MTDYSQLSATDVAVAETFVLLARRAARTLVLAHRVLAISFDAEPIRLIDTAMNLVDIAHDIEQALPNQEETSETDSTE
jgi:hypothetical protein